MKIDVKVAQLLASRICHDLAGGISALSTGAELLADEGSVPAAEALALISSSAEQTTRRLQFLRVAFGQGGGEGGTIAMANLRELTHGFLEGGRVSLVWSDGGERIALDAGKLLLNLCLIGYEALPRGGVLDISAAAVDGQLGFAVAAQGAGARLTAEMGSAMRVDLNVDELTPRIVHGHFTAILAENMGAELEIQTSEDGEVRLAALVPQS